MTTEGVRRSTRARKPVQRYATEQADGASVTTTAASISSKRKKADALDSDSDDDDDETAESAPNKRHANKVVNKGSEDEGDYVSAKKAKGKKSKATHHDSASEEDNLAAKKGRSKKAKASAKPNNPAATGWVKKGLSVFVVDPKTIPTDTSWHAEAAERRNAATQRTVKQLAPGEEEKRLRPYIEDPPNSYHNALKKVNKERMFVLSRDRGTHINCHAHHDDCPCETLEIAGSKGNVYTINISHIPTCDCPANIFMRKKEQSACKHVLYVLHKVLKVSGDLKQQNAFLTSELKDIFSNAPPLPSVKAAEEDFDGNRKPIDGDCPICFTEFEDGEEIVWCRAACGNNIHKTCMDEWIARKATCPYCRARWETQAQAKIHKREKVELAKVNMDVAKGAGGYRNVYDQLGYEDED